MIVPFSPPPSAASPSPSSGQKKAGACLQRVAVSGSTPHKLATDCFTTFLHSYNINALKHAIIPNTVLLLQLDHATSCGALPEDLQIVFGNGSHGDGAQVASITKAINEVDKSTGRARFDGVGAALEQRHWRSKALLPSREVSAAFVLAVSAGRCTIFAGDLRAMLTMANEMGLSLRRKEGCALAASVPMAPLQLGAPSSLMSPQPSSSQFQLLVDVASATALSSETAVSLDALTAREAELTRREAAVLAREAAVSAAEAELREAQHNRWIQDDNDDRVKWREVAADIGNSAHDVAGDWLAEFGELKISEQERVSHEAIRTKAAGSRVHKRQKSQRVVPDALLLALPAPTLTERPNLEALAMLREAASSLGTSASVAGVATGLLRALTDEVIALRLLVAKQRVAFQSDMKSAGVHSRHMVSSMTRSGKQLEEGLPSRVRDQLAELERQAAKIELALRPPMQQAPLESPGGRLRRACCACGGPVGGLRRPAFLIILCSSHTTLYTEC